MANLLGTFVVFFRRMRLMGASLRIAAWLIAWHIRCVLSVYASDWVHRCALSLGLIAGTFASHHRWCVQLVVSSRIAAWRPPGTFERALGVYAGRVRWSRQICRFIARVRKAPRLTAFATRVRRAHGLSLRLVYPHCAIACRLQRVAALADKRIRQTPTTFPCAHRR